MIELAVAIFIIALLLGSILVPLQTQVEQHQISGTQKSMDEMKEALVGFALANSYLPCPDTDGDGISNPAAPGACTSNEGWLPWNTLGVAQGDVWGNRFRYRVTPEFTNTPVSPCVTPDGRLGLCDSGNITVNTRTPLKAVQGLANNVVAVIVSHGKNGYGATTTAGVARPAAPAANVDEAENADADTVFATRTHIGVSAPCSDTAAPPQTFCEFDDVVTWLSAYTLFNRMVAAGKLP